MPDFSIAEAYFIVAMMILILIVCAAAVFVFFRQLKRERNNAEKLNERLKEQIKKRENSKTENASK